MTVWHVVLNFFPPVQLCHADVPEQDVCCHIFCHRFHHYQCA